MSEPPSSDDSPAVGLMDHLGTVGAGDAFLVCDARGTIAYLNGAAESLLGLAAALVLGRPLGSVLRLTGADGQDLDWGPIARQAQEAKSKPARWSCRLCHADGREQGLLCESVAVDSLVVLILTPQRRTPDDPRILAYRASHDDLTTLPNRAALQERLSLLHHSARALGGSYGLLLLDLDHFKIVNDRFGHAAGDRVLAQVGLRVVEQVRERDTVGRWGGEEFLCLLPKVGRRQAAEIAERVRAGVEASPIEYEQRHIRVTASIGAVAYPDDSKDPGALLAKADSALYEAKRAGRNRVRCHTSRSANVFSLANLIEHALRDDRIAPAYQPVVDLASGEVCGEEALARIQRTDGQWLDAAAFIPAAEQLNLVHRVDQRIIAQAVRRCVQRTLQDQPLSAMFVNFSADFLRHRDLVSEVLETVKQQCALCHDKLTKDKPLVVEITERQFLQDMDEAKQVLAPFLELGLRLAIDDFGAGHSSLNYLAELPVDFLKIEGTLVRRMVKEPRVRAVVQGIQSLAVDLGVLTVAEGVEDSDTLDLLRDIGIDWAQGYLFGRPQRGGIEPRG